MPAAGLFTKESATISVRWAMNARSWMCLSVKTGRANWVRTRWVVRGNTALLGDSLNTVHCCLIYGSPLDTNRQFRYRDLSFLVVRRKLDSIRFADGLLLRSRFSMPFCTPPHCSRWPTASPRPKNVRADYRTGIRLRRAHA